VGIATLLSMSVSTIISSIQLVVSVRYFASKEKPTKISDNIILVPLTGPAKNDYSFARLFPRLSPDHFAIP